MIHEKGYSAFNLTKHGDSPLVKVPTRLVPNTPLGSNWAWSPASSDDGNAEDALDYVAPLSISPKTPRKASSSRPA